MASKRGPSKRRNSPKVRRQNAKRQQQCRDRKKLGGPLHQLGRRWSGIFGG